MAELVYQSMSRNGVSTPSSAASQLTLSTSVLDNGIGLQLTTAINAECLVDPDDKVGFLLVHPGTSTAPASVKIAVGEGWQGVEAKTFTVGSTSTAEGTMTFVGPFESAKYVRYDSTTIGTGKPHIAMSLATGSTGATARVVAFKFPTVSYAT